jgi:hypothetical protein
MVQIWSLCDPHGRGTLDREQFGFALRLIALVQAGLFNPSDSSQLERATPAYVMALPNVPLARIDVSQPLAPPVTSDATAASPPMTASPPPAAEEDDFGDFESSAHSPPHVPSTATQRHTSPQPMPVPVPPSQAQAPDDDFGDFTSSAPPPRQPSPSLLWDMDGGDPMEAPAQGTATSSSQSPPPVDVASKLGRPIVSQS